MSTNSPAANSYGCYRRMLQVVEIKINEEAAMIVQDLIDTCLTRSYVLSQVKAGHGA